MKSNIPFIRLALVLAALLPVGSVRASDASSTGVNEDDSDSSGTTRVDVVVNLTDAGRKVSPPTPANPAYFLPMPGGYKDVGYAPFYGPKRNPPQSEIEGALYRALAQQGYQIMTHENHPSLVLAFSWGYMAPPTDDPQAKFDLNKGNPAQEAIKYNLYRQMLDMVAGNTFGDDIAPMDPRLDEVREMALSSRYYIYVAAFDFDSWLKNYKEEKSGHTPVDKPILLWRAHVSCELWGHYFDQVAQTLITSGAPWFGRETKVPQIATTPLIPLGRVIIGAPEVKNFQTKPAADKQ